MTASATIELLHTALSVSLPTFGWVVAGVVLQRAGLLSDKLILLVSKLAFNIGLPCMLFASACQVDYTTLGSARYLLAGVLATLLVLTASWIYSRWRGHPRAEQGIFVQAAFRSNLAIIGLALCVSAYGERGLVLAALPVAIMTVLYNILAVWVLNTTLGQASSFGSILLGIARNPLIIGISAGVLLSLSGLPVPSQIAPLGAGLSTVFLPPMLICIGGSIKLSDLRVAGQIAWEATFWRLCVAPLISILLALAMGVTGEPLGVLFLLVSSPVAAASFIMVVAARGNSVLAANVIVLTTVFSIISVTVGFFVLSLFSSVGELG